MKNFIEIYENVIPKEICKYLINFFNEQHQLNETYPGGFGRGRVDKTKKDCTDINALNKKYMEDEQHSSILEAYTSLVFNKFFDYLKTYTKNYYQPVIDEKRPIFKKPSTALMHMYEPPTQGYHKWHQDWASYSPFSSRMLVGMTY